MSVITSSSNDKIVTSTNRLNHSSLPSTVTATSSSVVATTSVNEPGESDTMKSIDEQTGTGGDSMKQEHL